MNPKGFLQIGGIILVLVGILGFVGVLGPTADESIFGEGWWFDDLENWAHLVLGVIVLILAFVAPDTIQKSVTMVVGILGVIIGLWSLFMPGDFMGANLENPADTILHIVIGAWALWASMKKAGGATMGNTPSVPGM